MYIKDIDFNAELKQLDIWIDFHKDSKFLCPKCSGEDCSVYDAVEKVWRHPNFFEYKTYLHYRIPRVKCDIAEFIKLKFLGLVNRAVLSS